MTTWIAVYRGDSVPTAKVIAVSSEPALVRKVAQHLLIKESKAEDPVLSASEQGQRLALRLIVASSESSTREHK